MDFSILLNYKIAPFESNNTKETDREYKVINPKNLDYSQCLKRIEIKYQSLNQIFSYGEDEFANVICKISFKAGFYEDDERYYHTILTVSKKESK